MRVQSVNAPSLRAVIRHSRQRCTLVRVTCIHHGQSVSKAGRWEISAATIVDKITYFRLFIQMCLLFQCSASWHYNRSPSPARWVNEKLSGLCQSEGNQLVPRAVPAVESEDENVYIHVKKFLPTFSDGDIEQDA